LVGPFDCRQYKRSRKAQALEHVTVNDGRQAIVGAVAAGGHRE
jgi:hypothetical protein